ncbi:MAG: trigger factor [Rikenellaceae bacterium]
MNIVREQRAELNSLIKITVSESDYAEAVEKNLREYKRKANVPGFRPGMVPMGVIKKMFGKGVLAEQSFRVASDAAFNYLKENKIDYLGDVIPSEEQGDFDFDNGTEFEFIFEIGEAPAFNVEISDKDQITYNKIAIEEKMRTDFRGNFLRRFGKLEDTDVVTSDEAVMGTLDNSEINVEEAYVGLVSMSEEERAPFIGKKVGDKMQVNVNEIYKTASQRAAILQVKEDELEGINPEFSFEITNIRRFAEPELNEEFFKLAFPAGEVTSEEGLAEFVDSQIAVELNRESDNMFSIQLRNFILEKANIQMPVAFLKRWLYTINEGKFSVEEIEKDFDQFLEIYTWNFIRSKVIEAEKLEVSQEVAMEEAKAVAQMQFAQYGMPSAPEDMLTNYAQQMLSDKEQAKRIFESLYDKLVIDSYKAKMTIVEKEVSTEEYTELVKSMQ